MSDLHFTDTGAGDKPSIMFLHGFMGSSDDFEFASKLGDQFRFITVDLPGHGKSQLEESNDYQMENVAEKIVELLDKLSISQSDLVGYSMGGRLALFLVSKYPKLFPRCVLESASPGLKTEQERKERRVHDEKLAVQLETKPLLEFLKEWFDQPLFISMRKSSGLITQTIEQRKNNNPAGLARSLRGMGTGSQPSLWNDLSKIQSELLLIVGSLDTKFGQINREIAARCQQASMRVVKDAGHNVHQEQPDDFLNLLKDFLS